MNAYGSNEAFQELTGIGATVAEAMAVAVLRVHKKFGDEAFGVIENWDTYEKDYTKLHDRIGAIYDEMREAVSGLDLELTTEGLFSDEIARGLCKVSFKRAPGIGPHMGDWPQALVQSLASAPAPNPKLKRERMAGKKAA